MRDVAEAADVAMSTVSRALTNPDRVSPGTRERVIEVARRLGYPAARPETRTRLLALLVNDVANPYNAALIRGAEAQARAAGCGLLVGSSQDGAESEAAQVDSLADTVDGFLLSSSRLSGEKIRDLARDRPVVLFNREVDGLPAVVADTTGATRQIVEHLAALGHRTLAYIAGPAELWTEQQRWSSLSAHSAAAGIDVRRVGPFPPSLDQGVPAADLVLATEATGVVAFNDLLAVGAMQRFVQRGVRVPDQLSVVGFDDIQAAAVCRPSLTTVRSPVERAGRTLVDLALGRLDGTAPIRLEARLVVRGSTGPSPAPTLEA